MGKTYRRDGVRGTQKNESYKKKIKNENLNRYSGYSSEDFEDDYESVENDLYEDEGMEFQ